MSDPWRSRIVGSGDADPTQLLANPANWRTHPGRQRDALRGSLDTVGWVQQVLVNRTTGHVVDGHARVEEAISRGEAAVPVLYVELTPDEEALVLATLDPIAAMAEPDNGKLAELLAEISVDDAGLAALLGDLSLPEVKTGHTDPDEVPEVGEGSNIKRGDLFALGDHRLLCGDATNPADVTRLLGGATPVSLAGLVNAPVSAYSSHLPFISEAIDNEVTLGDAIRSAEDVNDSAIDSILDAAPPEWWRNSRDRGDYRSFLIARRPRLRGLFQAERGIFPNLPPGGAIP